MRFGSFTAAFQLRIGSNVRQRSVSRAAGCGRPSDSDRRRSLQTGKWKQSLAFLPSFPNPRVLPCHLQVLVRSTETAIAASAVRNFDGLVLGIRHGHRATDPRTALLRFGVRYPEYRSDTTMPVVAIQ